MMPTLTPTPKPTPRVFIIRHGETEWSLNGRHTGTTELPLTPNGEKRIQATGQALVGDNRLINPRHLAHIYVSPRHRARRTLELLSLNCAEKFPWQDQRPYPSTEVKTSAKVQVTEDIREWDYGDYEGLTSVEIRAQRRREEEEREEGNGEKKKGAKWDIWRDGCPGGESPKDITTRLDSLIHEIRTQYHAKTSPDSQHLPSDVLIVAHGHILRAFAMRWIGQDLTEGVALLLEAGGVGTLSYEHNNINEPAILLGGAFTV